MYEVLCYPRGLFLPVQGPWGVELPINVVRLGVVHAGVVSRLVVTKFAGR